jgi:hypothetical protein
LDTPFDFKNKKYKQMKKNFIIFLLSTVCLPLFSQKQVIPISKTVNNKALQGFYYMLPATAFTLEVTIIKNTDRKGYYADYAANLLNLNNIIQQDKVSYQIKEIGITPFTIADTNHCYWVTYSSAQIKNGMPDKINEVIPKIEYPQNFSYSVSSTPIPDFYRNYADLAYTETDASFVETKIINGVVTQVPVSKTKKVSKTTAQQAQEAADFIASIRHARYDLLVGEQEVAYSEKTIQYMVEQLDQYEKNYLGLFTGFSVQEEIKYTFIVSPEKENSIPVFSFDAEIGIGKINAATNYYLHIIPEINHNQWDNVNRIKMLNSKYKTNNGYRIRKAVPATVTLFYGEQPIHSLGRYMIYQLGKIEVLPLGRDSFDIAKEVIIY